MKRFRQWLAEGLAPPEDAVLIAAGNAAAFERAKALILALTAGKSRLSVILGCPDTTAHDHLRNLFPACLIHGLNKPAGIPGHWVLSALRVRSLLTLAQPDTPKWLLEAARARAIPAYSLDPAYLTQPSADTFQRLIPTGKPAPSEWDIETLAQFLISSIGTSREQAGILDHLAGGLSKALKNRLVQTLLSPLIKRLDTIGSLQEQLGNPSTILCLGNGPTSNDARLSDETRDALFRVNHQWLAKGYLAKPDMVFAGVKRSMRKFSPIPIGVATARKETSLLSCRLFEPWHGRAVYAVVEDLVGEGLLPLHSGNDTNGTQPTTGAYMIAMAVALQPKRLIIAGMDMFNHPDGAYSNTDATVNAYTPAHNQETDTALIQSCLAVYEGELVCYSPAFLTLARQIGGTARFTLLDRSA